MGAPTGPIGYTGVAGATGADSAGVFGGAYNISQGPLNITASTFNFFPMNLAMPANEITQDPSGLTIEEDGTYLITYNVVMDAQAYAEIVDLGVLVINTS